MTSSPLRRSAIAALIAAAAVLTSACSSTPEPEESASAAPTAPAPVESSAAPTPAATTGPLTAPPCDELISASTVADFESFGWTSQEDVFRVGSLALDDGIVCRWADFTTASDQIQMFGWAPITASEAKAAQAELFASGWIEVDDPAPTIILTENPDNAISIDDEGYGQTYEFGDGWVLFADTKLSLLLIEPPQG